MICSIVLSSIIFVVLGALTLIFGYERKSHDNEDRRLWNLTIVIVAILLISVGIINFVEGVLFV